MFRVYFPGHLNFICLMKFNSSLLPSWTSYF